MTYRNLSATLKNLVSINFWSLDLDWAPAPRSQSISPQIQSYILHPAARRTSSLLSVASLVRNSVALSHKHRF